MEPDIKKLEELYALKQDCIKALNILRGLKDEYGELDSGDFGPLAAVVYNSIFAEVRAIRARSEFTGGLYRQVSAVVRQVEHETMQAMKEKIPAGDGEIEKKGEQKN